MCLHCLRGGGCAGRVHLGERRVVIVVHIIALANLIVILIVIVSRVVNTFRSVLLVRTVVGESPATRANLAAQGGRRACRGC